MTLSILPVSVVASGNGSDKVRVTGIQLQRMIHVCPLHSWHVVACHTQRFYYKLDVLGQRIPPPRHVLPMPPSGESVWMNVRQPFSISPNSDESGKTIPVSRQWTGSPPKFNRCSLVHCQAFLRISCKSNPKFLHKVTNKQTNNDHYISAPWRR